jgi:hypothetical protein
MPEMTDPYDALTSFQKALRAGILDIHRCELDPKLFVHPDRAGGVMRLTYVYLDRKTVTAFTNFVQTEPFEGLPCFQIGYAVPPAYRKQGRATALVKAAIAEMLHGFSRNKVPEFYVEAIVGRDNLASQKVAAKVLEQVGREIVDSHSGKPALSYMKKMAAGAS